jgi:hypothetical protein
MAQSPTPLLMDKQHMYLSTGGDMYNSANMQICTFEKLAGKCPIFALLSAGHTEKDFLSNPVLLKVLTVCAQNTYVSVYCIQYCIFYDTIQC